MTDQSPQQINAIKAEALQEVSDEYAKWPDLIHKGIQVSRHLEAQAKYQLEKGEG